MKRIVFLIVMVLLMVSTASADFLGIVTRTATRDTLAIPFLVLDSLGNPTSLASGDSVYVQVVSPGHTETYRDSMVYNDASIDFTAWEDFAGGQIYTYTERVSILDGSSTAEGIFTVKIWAQDLTGAALVTATTHTFQMVNSTLDGSLDSAAFAQQAVRATTVANTLDVTAGGEAGIDLDNTSGTLVAAEIPALAYFDTTIYLGKVWVDAGANTNTVVGVDGTPKNPVGTIAAAKTIADALGYATICLLDGASETIGETMEDYKFVGLTRSATINLGGQDVDGSFFENMTITGTQGGTGLIVVIDAGLSTLDSLEIHARNCAIMGDISLRGGIKTNHFDKCYSSIAGNDTPALNFNDATDSIYVNWRAYSGGLELQNMTTNHVMSYETIGQLVINANCDNGNVTTRGFVELTNNGTSMNITKDAVFSRQEAVLWMWSNIDTTANVDTSLMIEFLIDRMWDELLTGGTHNVNNSSGKILRQIKGGFVIHDGTSDNTPANGANAFSLETGGGSPITSTIDDFYNHQILNIAGGTGEGQAVIISDYNGTNQVATITPAFLTTPDATSVYEITVGLTHAETQGGGYALGAVWISPNGTAGTQLYVNGTIDNPIDDGSFADAKTVADALNITTFRIENSSNITLAATYNNYSFDGTEWTLALGGQDVALSTFRGADVTGIATGANVIEFFDCKIGAVQLPASDFFNCGFGLNLAATDSLLATGTGQYIFRNCYSLVSGPLTPVFALGDAIANTKFGFRNYDGGLELSEINSTGNDSISIEGFGNLVLNATDIGGELVIRGNWTIDSTAGGSLVNLTRDAALSGSYIADVTWDEDSTGHYTSPQMAFVASQTGASATDTANIKTMLVNNWTSASSGLGWANMFADSAWLRVFPTSGGTFEDSAKVWGATSASALDSAIVSNIIHRVVFGIPVGSGSDSTTLAQRKVNVSAMDANVIESGDFATGAIDADAIAPDAIGESELAANAITASEIATAAIGALEIATDAIGASEIATAAIGALEIATDAIGASEIATDAIGSAEMASSATLVEIPFGVFSLDTATVGIISTDYGGMLKDTTAYQGSGAGGADTSEIKTLATNNPSLFYGPTATGIGTDTITMYVVDTAGTDTLLQDIKVTLTNAGGSVVGSGFTDAAGLIVFYQDAGTYNVIARGSPASPTMHFFDSRSLVVSGNNANDTTKGYDMSIDAPTGSNGVSVYGFIYGADNQPIEFAVVTVELPKGMNDTCGNTIIADFVETDRTDSNGRFDFELLKSKCSKVGTYTIRIKAKDAKETDPRQFTVPDSTTFKLVW